MPRMVYELGSYHSGEANPESFIHISSHDRLVLFRFRGWIRSKNVVLPTWAWVIIVSERPGV